MNNVIVLLNQDYFIKNFIITLLFFEILENVKATVA